MNIWKLNNTLLNKWIKKEMKGEVKMSLETNENNRKTTYQYLRNTAKAVLRGKLISINAHVKK